MGLFIVKRKAELFNTIVCFVCSYFPWIIPHLRTERMRSLCLDMQSRATWIFFCFAHYERNHFFAATDQDLLSFQIAFVLSATDVAHVVIGRVFRVLR